ncbi:hypothetical protein BHE74_00055467 [Ensete ventricosum]|nr:hypothetical protein GW17_00018393 [Ensete ventricosum]RWW39225.1 hypothetical protein BHE74_00055467 [Ensete ventricosum]RZR97333.1 hypothetical protein BHM03_00026476 [Ensete ventricosum]
MPSGACRRLRSRPWDRTRRRRSKAPSFPSLGLPFLRDRRGLRPLDMFPSGFLAADFPRWLFIISVLFPPSCTSSDQRRKARLSDERFFGEGKEKKEK